MNCRFNLYYRVLNDRYGAFLLPARSRRKIKRRGTYTSCPTAAANIFRLATAVVE
jgi:hypothetical protein